MEGKAVTNEVDDFGFWVTLFNKVVILGGILFIIVQKEKYLE